MAQSHTLSVPGPHTLVKPNARAGAKNRNRRSARSCGRELGSEVPVESKEVRKKNWASADIRKSHDVLRKILYYSVNLAIQELLPV